MDVKSSIKNNLNFFESMSKDEIFDHRKNKFLKIGRDNGFNQSSKLEDKNLLYKEPSFAKIKKNLIKNKAIYMVSAFLLLALIFGVLL